VDRIPATPIIKNWKVVITKGMLPDTWVCELIQDEAIVVTYQLDLGLDAGQVHELKRINLFLWAEFKRFCTLPVYTDRGATFYRDRKQHLWAMAFDQVPLPSDEEA